MDRYSFAGISDAAVMKMVISVILFVALTIMVQPAYAEDEAINVACYKGNLEEGNNLGNITVTKPETAGQDCNSTFYDCEGKCVGCYYDRNLGKNICYDKAGEQFPKKTND